MHEQLEKIRQASCEIFSTCISIGTCRKTQSPQEVALIGTIIKFNADILPEIYRHWF